MISASLQASIDFSRKVPEQFRLGMTDSDGEKENYDDFEPSMKHQKLKLPSSAKREAALCRDGISRRNGEYFEGICPQRYGKEQEVGNFNFLAVGCCTE